MKRSDITITMSKKQLKMVVLTMGIALESDCKAMMNLSNKQLDKLLNLYTALQTMSKTIK
jgi:hypothetical protein